MEKPRLVETGSSSFFGEYLYDQVVPQGHFLTSSEENHRMGAVHKQANQIVQKRRSG